MSYNQSPVPSEEILYDLRQVRALRIGKVLELIDRAIILKDFVSWFDHLDHLYMLISNKLKPDTDIKEYEKLLKATVEVINKNSNAFTSQKNGDDNNKKAIYNKLRELYTWLEKKMEDKGIYGKKSLERL